MKIIVVASHMDLVTSISAELGLKFADWARKQGHDVTVLYGWEATRLPLLLSLLGDVDFVYYTGHGDVDALIGNELLFGLVTPFNASWLRDKLTAVMACLSAQTLGKQVVEEGGYAYIGAYDVLYAAFNEEYDYLSDWLNYMLLLPKGIVEDKIIGDALNDLKMKALERSLYYEREKPDDSWDWYANSTLHNSKVYTLIGNPELRLSDILKMREERKAMSFGEGLRFLFSPETIKEQWPSAVRSLMSFGAVGAIVGGMAVSAAVKAVGGPEWATGVAEKVGQVVGGAYIPV